MPLPNIIEFIGTNITQRKFQQAQEKLLNYLGVEVPTKTELNSEISKLNNAITPKADKIYVDSALSSFQNGALKTYPTLAEANADIANIALNTKVSVLSVENGGDYYKATAGATSLTKSAFDPVMQAKAYTNAIESEILNAISAQISKTLTLKVGTSYISNTGASVGLAGRGIYSIAVQPGEIYRVVNQLTSTTAAQRGYAFYSNTTVSAESFIAGADASNAARTEDNILVVPPNAVMLCVSNYTTLTATIYSLDLKDNGTVKALADSSAKNSVVLNNRKSVHNVLDSLFEKPVNFYADLSLVKAAPFAVNSNTNEPAYTFSPYIASEDTSVIAYTENTDANVGYIREFSANYGFTASRLISIASILEKTKIIFGVKITSDVAPNSVIEVTDGSGNASRFKLQTGVADASYQFNTQVSEFTLLAKFGDYYVYSLTYAGSTVSAQKTCRLAVRNTSTSGTFAVGLFGVKAFKYSDDYNYYLDASYSNTKDSPYLSKNLMFFGDSQSRVNIAFQFVRQLGTNVYWNANASRAMKYRSGQSAQSDLNWLYHLNRRQHIVNAVNAGGDFDLFVFNVSYNDAAGGGTLSDAAIQAVLDNYPAIGDDEATVTAKLALFNAMSETQRESTFAFKQTFAAMLKQIIEYQPNAKIFLTTILYTPQGNGTSEQQRALIKATRNSCNADIREIADWFGVSVVDTASNAGHYFGNMKSHTSDGLHFDEVIGKRIGYFTAKSILMQTI